MFNKHCRSYYQADFIFEDCCNEESKEHVPLDKHDYKGSTDEECDQELEEYTYHSSGSKRDIYARLHKEAPYGYFHMNAYESFQGDLILFSTPNDKNQDFIEWIVASLFENDHEFQNVIESSIHMVCTTIIESEGFLLTLKISIQTKLESFPRVLVQKEIKYLHENIYISNCDEQVADIPKQGILFLDDRD